MTDQQIIADILSQTLFPLGRLIYSSDIAYAVQESDFNALPYLKRHSQKDWGDVPFEDGRSNDRAFKAGDRLFSMYESEIGQIYIITEHDHSVTSIITPAEY